MQNYNAESIESLDYFDHVRKYPGMYIGSKDLNGLHHCAKEIISNSIDEFLNGAGSRIIIKVQKDGGIYIEDNGRGIPHGKHPSGCSLLQACFGIQNTGGKFNNATGESGYNTSGGEHGTGGKAVNALSTKLVVTTAREGIKETVEFSRGKFIKDKSEKSDEQGVSVLFYADAEIFETVQFDIPKLKEMIREFSFLCKGLVFTFIDEAKDTTEDFISQNGLEDYLTYLNKSTMLCDPIHIEAQDGSYQLEAIVGYNSNYSGITRLYTNNIPQDKGTHLTGFKTAWTGFLNAYAKENKILKEKEPNLTGSDFEEGQILILNFKMIDPVFKGQNKEELSSSEGRTYVQRLTTEFLQNHSYIFDKSLKMILSKAIEARRAREAARKARDAARGIEKKKKEKAVKFDTKLADANSKDRSRCEIYITEGDSASGNLKLARDNETQAILPVRGKILNVRKATLDKIQKNAEIMNMIEAFGLTVDKKTMKLTFDKENLRYGKIIIMSDADVDGAHIKNLFYTFIWTFCPDLIKEGYVYAGVPPLYRVTETKDKYVYLKDDAALDEYRAKHPGKKLTLTRMKGLGEMDVKETHLLTDPDQRIINQVTVEDAKAADKLFDDLMGDAVIPRKEYIKKHSNEATYQI